MKEAIDAFLVIVYLVAIPIAILTISFFVYANTIHEETERQKQWRDKCRAAGGTVVEDYRGWQECINPKVKVIED